MLIFNDHVAGIMIAGAAGVHYNPKVDACIARFGADGEPMGGVIYTTYTNEGGSVCCHLAGFKPNWANIDLLWAGFDYPFNRLKVSRVFGHVPSYNIKALELDKKLGFKEVARIANVFPDGDLVILEMTREDCKWLKLKPRMLRED